MKKELKIVLTNYLALIDSILSNCDLKDHGAIIKLKADRKSIIKILGDLENENIKLN